MVKKESFPQPDVKAEDKERKRSSLTIERIMEDRLLTDFDAVRNGARFIPESGVLQINVDENEILELRRRQEAEQRVFEKFPGEEEFMEWIKDADYLFRKIGTGVSLMAGMIGGSWDFEKKSDESLSNEYVEKNAKQVGSDLNEIASRLLHIVGSMRKEKTGKKTVAVYENLHSAISKLAATITESGTMSDFNEFLAIGHTVLRISAQTNFNHQELINAELEKN